MDQAPRSSLPLVDLGFDAVRQSLQIHLFALSRETSNEILAHAALPFTLTVASCVWRSRADVPPITS